MELCNTKTLRLWIDEKDTQNVKKSLRDSKRREESQTIAKQIVSGVDYVHSKRLIHRDLKVRHDVGNHHLIHQVTPEATSVCVYVFPLRSLPTSCLGGRAKLRLETLVWSLLRMTMMLKTWSRERSTKEPHPTWLLSRWDGPHGY